MILDYCSKRVRGRHATWSEFWKSETGAWVGLGLTLVINRTRHGKILRAVIHDREISMAMGVNVSRVYLVTFTVGATKELVHPSRLDEGMPEHDDAALPYQRAYRHAAH